MRIDAVQVVVVAVSSQQQELTWYQYYTDGGRTSGLTADEVDFFRLNGRPMRIVSGAVHYFRVHPVYWPDRLAKVRAAGCNAVETSVLRRRSRRKMALTAFSGAFSATGTCRGTCTRRAAASSTLATAAATCRPCWTCAASWNWPARPISSSS